MSDDDVGWRLYTALVLAPILSALLVTSPFPARFRPIPWDPPFGGDARFFAAALIGVALAWAPLLLGRHAWRGWVATSVWAAVVGTYEWTNLPWDRLFSRLPFAGGGTPPAGIVILAAAPFLALGLIAVLQGLVRVPGDLASRGADPESVARVRRAGMVQAAVAGVVTVVLWTVVVVAWTSPFVVLAPPGPVAAAPLLGVGLAAVALASAMWYALANRGSPGRLVVMRGW